MSTKVTVRRVLKGEDAVKPLDKGGFTHGEIPEDGYLLRIGCPGSIPIYIRDVDLQKAMAASDIKEDGVTVTAESWGGESSW